MREVYSEAARFGGPERGLFGLLSSELSGRNPYKPYSETQ